VGRRSHFVGRLATKKQQRLEMLVFLSDSVTYHIGKGMIGGIFSSGVIGIIDIVGRHGQDS